MRVLYIHQHFSTPQGCGGTRSYEFAKKLIQAGHQVTMVCGSHSMANTGLVGPFKKNKREGIVEGIRIIEFQIDYSNKTSFLLRSWKFLLFSLKNILLVFKEDYDLLYATSTPLTTAVPGIVSKLFKPKVPFIFEVRDLWPELPREMGVIKNRFILMGMLLLERLAYRYADRGVGLAPGICRGMKRFHTLDDKTVSFIPNGCDNTFFSRDSSKEEQAKIPTDLQRLLEGESFTAVFAGAHGMANGLDAALDAAYWLKQKHIDHIQFVFIGDGKLRQALIDRAKKEKLDNCHFFAPIPKGSLRWAFKRADVGLMLLSNVKAFYEGTSPNKFFDYIASGLPVLNNYPGWLRTLIGEYDCGICVAPDSPKAFAKALQALSELSTEDLNKMSYNGSQLAKERFDRLRLGEQFLTLCEEVVR